MNPHDPDARISSMKNGSTHLAHKAEHAVDMDTGAVVAVTLQEADSGDNTTMKQTAAEAGTTVAELIEREAETRPAEKPRVHLGGIEEVAADKGISQRAGIASDEGRWRAHLHSGKEAGRQAALGGQS